MPDRLVDQQFLSSSETADLLGFPRTTISRVWSVKEKISIEAVVWIKKRAEQPRNAERHLGTTGRTLKEMGYSGRRPIRGPLLSARNRKVRPTSTHRLTKTGLDWKIGKTLPGRVGSEFGVNNTAERIHLAFPQPFRLLLVV